MDTNINPGKPESEVKFVINNYRTHQILNWLKCNCKPDPKYPAGIVSSIYFDTWNWQSLNEKVNSDYLKTKIRLRWYSDLDNHPGPLSFAEAKFKIGYKRKKIRLKTPYSGEWLSNVGLEDTALQKIPRLLQSDGVDLKQPYFPAYQIEYTRYRFVEPSRALRICFDSNISVPRVNRFMLPKLNPFALTTAVFELKGDTPDLPYPLYPLMKLGLKKSSFSKYQVCFDKMLGI